MLITTKFDVFEKVTMVDISKEAMVVEVIIAGSDLMYKLEYWYDT